MLTKDAGETIDRRSLVVGGAVAASVGSVPATGAAAEQCERPPPFEFLGHRIGDGLEKFPELADGSWINNQNSWTRSGYVVGGISVDLAYVFENGRLISVAISFDSEYRRELREMLIGKYGEPYEYTTTVYLMIGGSHGTTLSHWMFREGSLVLTGVFAGDRNKQMGLLALFPYDVPQSPDDPKAAQLRMLGKRTF